MPRNVPSALAADMANGSHTLCYVLKIMPVSADTFGLTTTNIDIDYDDGTGSRTYRCRRGYERTDVMTRTDMSVDNAEAHGLAAQYPLDGVTIEGINRGDYDDARFVQYLINYENPSHGKAFIDGGTIGQIKISDKMGIQIELRGLVQTLKQRGLIELTSITDRAQYGDERNKVTLVWYDGVITSVGTETDRVFVVDFATSSGAPSFAPDYFTPGVVHWLSGDNTPHENEIEAFQQVSDGTVQFTLMIPTRVPIVVGDTLKVRQDSDGSWATAVDRGYYLNFRGEPFLQRADGDDMQSPTSFT